MASLSKALAPLMEETGWFSCLVSMGQLLNVREAMSAILIVLLVKFSSILLAGHS